MCTEKFVLVKECLRTSKTGVYNSECSVKLMLTVPDDMKESITIDFLAIVNGAFYCQLPKQNSLYLLNDPRILS